MVQTKARNIPSKYRDALAVSPWDSLVSTWIPWFEVLWKVHTRIHMTCMCAYMCTFRGTPLAGVLMDKTGPQELMTL